MQQSEGRFDLNARRLAFLCVCSHKPQERSLVFIQLVVSSWTDISALATHSLTLPAQAHCLTLHLPLYGSKYMYKCLAFFPSSPARRTFQTGMLGNEGTAVAQCIRCTRTAQKHPAGNPIRVYGDTVCLYNDYNDPQTLIAYTSLCVLFLLHPAVQGWGCHDRQQ
jgi:hypothetical protein